MQAAVQGSPLLTVPALTQPLGTETSPGPRSSTSLQFQSQPSGVGSAGSGVYWNWLKSAAGFTNGASELDGRSRQSLWLDEVPAGHAVPQNSPVGTMAHLLP